jgi:hypothetical protein
MKVKEEIIGKVKKSIYYKLIKTSEAAIVVGGLAAGIIFDFFALIPALILILIYVILNVTGLSNEPLYVVRDEIKNRVDSKRV